MNVDDWPAWAFPSSDIVEHPQNAQTHRGEVGEMTFPSKSPQSRIPGRPAVKAPSTMTLGSVSRGVSTNASRLLIYGVGGVGKTTFAAESPSPIFIDTQDGSGRLDVARFPRPGSWGDVLAAVNALTVEAHEYKTLVLDLLDDLESMAWDHMCARDGQSSVEGYGYGKGYKVALVEWRTLIAGLERLRAAKGMGIIFVAHAGIKSFKNPEGEDYDRYGLQLHEGAAGLIRGWCDTVLFARHETAIKIDQKKRVRGISTGARVIQTVETAAYYAKNRGNLPDTIALDYAEFKAAMAAGVPARAEDMLSEIARLSQGIDEDTRKKVESATLSCDGNAVALARVLNRLKEISSQTPQETES